MKLTGAAILVFELQRLKGGPGSLAFSFGSGGADVPTIHRFLFLAGTAFLCGCTSEPAKTEVPVKETDASKPREFAPAEFSIGTTQFGFDNNKCSFDVKEKSAGQMLLTIEMRGDDAIARQLREDKKSPWFWILGGPYFYLRSYPVQSTGKEKELAFTLKPEDYDKYDVALYQGEHNRVKDVTVAIFKDQIEIAGQVDLELISKPWTPFRISWKKAR